MPREEFRVDLTADNELSEEARKAAEALEAIPETVETKLELSGVDKAISKLDELHQESSAAAVAAEELGRKLGPELAGRADMTAVVAELNRLGASFDEITANADAFAAKLREVDTPDLGGKLGQAMGTARGETEKLADSARGANSALANVVGNSAQDIAGLGGVVGTLGQAFGQMGEYAADAALGGERLGSAMGSMAKILGPVLAIGAAFSAVSSAMEAHKRRAEDAAERTEQLGDAMEGAANDAVGFADSFKQNESALRDFDASLSLLGGLGTALNDLGKGVPLLGRLFQDTTVDVVAALADTGNSLYEFARAIDGGAASRAAFIEELGFMRDAGFISSDQFHALAQAVEEYGAAADTASSVQKIMNVNAAEANALLDELVTKADPMAQMAGTWRTLFDDMADGSIDTQAAADAVNALAKGLGLTQEEVVRLAQQHLDEEMQAAGEAAAEQRQRVAEAAEALKEWALQAMTARGQLQDIADAFSQMSISGEALSSVFDLGNAPLDLAGQVRDITIAIDGLSDAAEGVDLSEPLDPSNVKADALLDAIDQLRPQIQTKIVEAFSAGGPEAATALANSYIDQVVAELGGRLSREEVAKLLGLENIPATIEVAIQQGAIETAKRQLEILTGVTGENSYTASIALALDAGLITGEQAQALIQAQLAGAGVEIPAALAVPTTGPAVDAANAAVAGTPVTVPTDADPSGAAAAVEDFAGGPQPSTTVDILGNPQPAEEEAEGFTSTQRRTTPVDIDASTFVATAIMLAFLTAKRTTTIDIQANALPASVTIAALVGRAYSTNVNVTTSGIGAAESAINTVARDRSVTIRPSVVPTSVLVRVDGGG